MKQVPPGSTIGILGSGQLGRMLAQVAHRMGYRTVVYSPASNTPAGAVANLEVQGEYEDEGALKRFAETVDVVTLEFENIPASALQLLERHVPVRPGPEALRHTQNRSREKAFLARSGLPHAVTVDVPSPADLPAALERTGTPAVLKTAGFGYDGKGQMLLQGAEDVDAAAGGLGNEPAVLEAFVEFERELSVLVCRWPNGATQTFGPIENRHRERILDTSVHPARCAPNTATVAREIAVQVAEELELVGVACVELFELDSGDLLVNEIAPRPHNSGHLTIEGCTVSQFELQLRAVCGLPAVEIRAVSPCAMANMLGDLWEGGEPNWSAALEVPGVALHLYGKAEARPGRKMGHLTALAGSPAEALSAVEGARASVTTSPTT